jgi:hypothetical protein
MRPLSPEVHRADSTTSAFELPVVVTMMKAGTNKAVTWYFARYFRIAEIRGGRQFRGPGV